MENMTDFPIKEDKDKAIVTIKQSKGQLEASIQKVEAFLNIEEFKDYCDSVHTCMAYQDVVLKRIKES